MSDMPRIQMPGLRPFAPRVSAFTRPFWEALGTGRLLTTGCTGCGRLSFPPRNLCRTCWSTDLHWRALPAQGSLYSFTRVHVAPSAFRSDTPYAIGIIDLAQGPRLMCRLVGPIDTQDLDQTMQMVVLQYDDGPLFAAQRSPERPR
jgi:uncharacterized OB-fold protein